MKRFVEGEDRTQGFLLPEFLGDYVRSVPAHGRYLYVLV
jgi:hypothetical protein